MRWVFLLAGGSGTGPILLSQATFLLAHIANFGPVPVYVRVARMNSEEALLESEFGERYADYRRRTWRLLPFLY